MKDKTAKMAGGVVALGGLGVAIWYFFFRGEAEAKICETSADCPAGYVCVDGVCVEEGVPNVGVGMSWD